MNEDRKKHWEKHIGIMGLDDRKTEIMSEAERFDKIAREMDQFLLDLSERGYRPETIAFAVTQELTKFIKAITTVEVMKFGEPKLHKVLSDLIRNEGGPIEDDELKELTGILAGIFGKVPPGVVFK